MELAVELLDPFGSVPRDTFVALRVGDISKQARLAPSRTYRFPNQKCDTSSGYGHLEIFRRVGAATVVLPTSPDEPVNVDVRCADAELQGLRMRLVTRGTGLAVDKPDLEEQDAMRYMDKHRLEEIFALAMCDVLRQRPKDPCKFLAEHLFAISGGTPAKLAQDEEKPAVQPVKTPTQEASEATQDEKATVGGDFIGGEDEKAIVGGDFIGGEVWPSIYAKFAKPEPVVPVRHMPSVGSWFMRKPAKLERMWYYEPAVHPDSPRGQRVKKLQEEILQRDHELNELRTHLNAILARVGKDKFAALGLKFV